MVRSLHRFDIEAARHVYGVMLELFLAISSGQAHPLVDDGAAA
jgi:hypothetical protein